MTNDRPVAQSYIYQQPAEPRLDDWPAFEDIQGLTPPREFESDSKLGVGYTQFHGQFLNTGPPTPPRTEAYSSPTRSSSASPNQLESAASSTRPSSADGITMTHDGDVIMSSNWAPVSLLLVVME